MLSALRSLALEVWFLDDARAFYVDHLGLPVAADRERELVLDAGGTALVLREPGAVPRGGLHVHYALATPPGSYDDWRATLDDAFDAYEHDFGGFRSCYVYDPDDHCVEVGGVGGDARPRAGDDGDGPAHPLAGVFEVVLEVESLDRAEAFYRALGFEVTGRGDERPRVRLGGPVDLELWEPQRGLADARGGVHADLEFVAADPSAAADAVADRACDVTDLDGGVRVRDPDGHYLTFARR